MFNTPFGLSFRFGPNPVPADFYRKLSALPFGVWNLPLNQLGAESEKALTKRQCIVSYIVPYETITSIADEGSDKMRMQLRINFAAMLDNVGNCAQSIVLDMGFADGTLHTRPDVFKKRLRLLRELWTEAYLRHFSILLPIRFPLPEKDADKQVCAVLRESLCANIGLIADVRIHDFKRAVDVEKLFENVLFDVRAVRLNYDAQDGNVLLPQVFAPWKKWVDTAHPSAPVLFEPHEHVPERFETLARELAELSDIADDLILR